MMAAVYWYNENLDYLKALNDKEQLHGAEQIRIPADKLPEDRDVWVEIAKVITQNNPTLTRAVFRKNALRMNEPIKKGKKVKK